MPLQWRMDRRREGKRRRRKNFSSFFPSRSCFFCFQDFSGVSVSAEESFCRRFSFFLFQDAALRGEGEPSAMRKRIRETPRGASFRCASREGNPSAGRFSRERVSLRQRPSLPRRSADPGSTPGAMKRSSGYTSCVGFRRVRSTREESPRRVR